MATNVFAKRVSQLREAFGLTQAQLADKVGVSREQVVRWESGKNAAPPGRVADLCEALGIDEEQFWDPNWLPGKNGEPDPLDEPYDSLTHIEGLEHLTQEEREEIERDIRAYIRVKIAEAEERRRRGRDNGK